MKTADFDRIDCKGRKALLTGKTSNAAWRSKPSWYVLATRDHTVHPDLQRWVSKRMGATVTEVESSHVPMLSKPEVVIDVIRKAAAAVMEKTKTLAHSS